MFYYVSSPLLAGYAYIHKLTDSRQKQYTPNSWVGDPAEKLSVINVECLIPDTLPYDCNTHTWLRRGVCMCEFKPVCQLFQFRWSSVKQGFPPLQQCLNPGLKKKKKKQNCREYEWMYLYPAGWLECQHDLNISNRHFYTLDACNHTITI